jgi:hypothetical protein
MSGPNMLSAIFMSSNVTGLFLKQFSYRIALKSFTLGLPRALYKSLAFLARWNCLSVKKSFISLHCCHKLILCAVCCVWIKCI